MWQLAHGISKRPLSCHTHEKSSERAGTGDRLFMAQALVPGNFARESADYMGITPTDADHLRRLHLPCTVRMCMHHSSLKC